MDPKIEEYMGKLERMQSYVIDLYILVKKLASLESEDGGRSYPSKDDCRQAKKIIILIDGKK